MAEKQIFSVLLEQHEKSNATWITIPFDVERVFGAKRVPVKVRIKDAAYRSTVVRMDGSFIMVVPQAFRRAAGIAGGETIEVTMERAVEKRNVEALPELAAAIEKAGLREVWGKLSYTRQNEHVRAVEEAKKKETRMRRIEKTIAQLVERKK